MESTNRLRSFLASEKGAVGDLFTTRVQSQSLRSTLAAGLPRLLDSLEQAVEQGAWSVESIPGSADLPRLQGGDPGALVREFALLRDSLLDRMQQVGLQLSLDEFRLLSDCLSGALAQAVTKAMPTHAPVDLGEVRREAIAAGVRASEERYRSIFESLDDGFCIIEMLYDAQGKPDDYRFLESNKAFERHTGLVGAVGKTVREFVPSHDEHWFRLYGAVVATGNPVRYEDEAVAMGRWFEVTASRIDPPELHQVAVVFKDCSIRKKAEQQREHLIAELGKSNATLDQFAYITSHDLKAPLRGIASLAHWIEEDLGDTASDETKQNLHLMRVRVQRLEALINGILSYSTAGRRKNEPESVDVGKLLTEVVELLAPPASVSLTVGDAMPTVVAERTPLQQVFMNLIGNAVKYTQRPDPVIRVEARDEGESVHFTIADNGPGIAPEFHERIWGLFQKLEARSDVEGTGIGLSVVKKIVETRGGKTWVESELGQGTTFHVLWPRVPPASQDDRLR